MRWWTGDDALETVAACRLAVADDHATNRSAD
jgi:hypothetical protein